MSSVMTKNRPNCCAKAVSARHRGTLRTFVGKYPSWGGNVLSWLDGAALLAVLRFEDLVADPRGAATRAVSSLMPDLAPAADVSTPSFDELHGIDPDFFRRGVVRSYRDEMPDELHELFWAQTENAVAMRRLSYGWSGNDVSGDGPPNANESVIRDTVSQSRGQLPRLE
jgi:hypothetical protein